MPATAKMEKHILKLSKVFSCLNMFRNREGKLQERKGRGEGELNQTFELNFLPSLHGKLPLEDC